MPEVVIRRNPKVIPNRFIQVFIDDLIVKLAAELSCSGGMLTAKDITVFVYDTGPLDRNVKDLNITIDAHHYAERAGRLVNTGARMMQWTKSRIIGEVTWYMWIKLGETVYLSDSISDGD